ncbi:uncharacterized protein AB675_9375 [Cyphellophora attinorum]|uniref:N-acetyltransferase domain-containing protein n=1 Tax=Cyphellophora attinorum TaxID=1664694 RepID=A0A0N1HBM6_9EURO|nr:uncharacterized protein AB675_9375 [Phialophora attinorum]KPI41482.1 hypothetical protein AB675_9375 [Phialophora attinorum]
MAQPTLFSYFSKQPPTITIPHQSLATIPMNSSSIVIPASTHDAHWPPTKTASKPTSSLLAKPSPHQSSSSHPPHNAEAEPQPTPQPTHHPSIFSPPQSRATPQPFTITRIDPSHIPALKQLTASILPIAYSPKFYTEAISDPDVVDFTHVVLAHDRKPVGWITCRVIRSQPESEPPLNASATAEAASPAAHLGTHQLPACLEGKSGSHLYIRALCILAPYREQGFASRLLAAVLSDPAHLLKYSITAIYAHVWESNTSALEWYEKRDFRKVKLERAYYRRLKPSGAWIVSRDLRVGDLLPAASAGGGLD